MSEPRPLSVGILVFDAVEVLDFAGPYEVFTTASRVAAKRKPEANKLFEVTCISRDGLPVQARAGLRVLPEHSFAQHPTFDLLIVPGGVVDAAMACPQTLAWLARTAALGSGLVTTHWEDVADLQARFPALTVLNGPRWIDNGTLVTSAGISAGIDMCLHLVARLADSALAERTARQMDYPWKADEPA
ncbi:MAG: ThiJ/PfpI [Comamonadaceae bacterium]|nr:MAG: ThiJ/PfpI [Comamonadaceae bacterium]